MAASDVEERRDIRERYPGALGGGAGADEPDVELGVDGG
jgi:hypothetical protein